MADIPLTQGRSTVIDDEDYERARQYSWHFRREGYAARSYRKNRKVITQRMHQFILGRPPKGMEIDHINGDKLDNRRCNLRFATHQQNACNTMKRRLPESRHPSMHKGVTWRSDGHKWRSRITVNGKTLSLGSFRTQQEASLAYNEAASRLYKEFAQLNKITGGNTNE